MRKAKKVSLSILWFVLISISGVVFSQQCINDTGFFIAEGTYDKNRKHILTSLVTNVTVNGGFYNSSIGEVPDQVYAMGMCINGTEPTLCSDCIKVAINQLIQNCPIQTEAFTWVPRITLCFARYSNISFFEKLSTHPRYSEHNSMAIMSYLGPFESNWKEQLKEMIQEAQNTSGSFSNKTLYASMKCTPDLSPANCSTCLGKSVSDYEDEKDFRGTQGGIIAFSGGICIPSSELLICHLYPRQLIPPTEKL